MFLKNVGSYKSHTASHPRRRHSSSAFETELVFTEYELTPSVKEEPNSTAPPHINLRDAAINFNINLGGNRTITFVQ
jgi:hypothetical protein